jgi:hypothetical protein
MLQEGSSIEIAAVISGHIAAAPPSERALPLEFLTLRVKSS